MGPFTASNLYIQTCLLWIIAFLSFLPCDDAATLNLAFFPDGAAYAKDYNNSCELSWKIDIL